MLHVKFYKNQTYHNSKTFYMVDGFQIKVPNTESTKCIHRNSKLCFSSSYSSCGGLNDLIQTADYKSLRFKYIRPRSIIYIKGNLYEYYTGLKNYENFRLYNAFEAFQQLHDEFNLDI